MTETHLHPPLHSQDEREDGFTLVEILVVIIIIGILAAVAIPIFLNQQRAARDSATSQDVRNLASSVTTALAGDPEATEFNLYVDEDATTKLRPNTAGHAELTEVYLKVGDTTPMKVTKTEGTVLDLRNADKNGYTPTEEQPANAGSYVITGYNRGGLEFRGPAPEGNGTYRTYFSDRGGQNQWSE